MGMPITVTDDDLRSLLRDYTRHVLTAPSMIVLGIVLALFAVACVVLSVLTGEAFGYIYAALIGVGAIAFVFVLRFILRRSFTASLPVGSSLVASVADGQLHSVAVSGSSSVPLTQFRRVTILHDSLVLRRAPQRIDSIMPLRAFTHAEIDAIVARVGRS